MSTLDIESQVLKRGGSARDLIAVRTMSETARQTRAVPMELMMKSTSILAEQDRSDRPVDSLSSEDRTTLRMDADNRICVAGAGAIGGVLAAQLAAAGHRVNAFARGETRNRLRTQGLRLTELSGTVHARVIASDQPEFGVQDVIFLCAKAHELGIMVPKITPPNRGEHRRDSNDQRRAVVVFIARGKPL